MASALQCGGYGWLELRQQRLHGGVCFGGGGAHGWLVEETEGEGSGGDGFLELSHEEKEGSWSRVAEVDEAAPANKRRLPAVPWGRAVKARRGPPPLNGPPLKKAKAKAESEEGESKEDSGAGSRMPIPFLFSVPTRRAAAASTGAPSFCFSRFVEEAETGVLPQCCRKADEAYEMLVKVGEGAYGVVFRARDSETGEVVALKKLKMGTGGLPQTALREISIMASLRHHPCIVGLKEVVSSGGREEEDSVFIVMEYAEYDLRRVVKGMKRPFDESEVKFLMLRLLQGICAIHDAGVLHRDLKTSNLLVDRHGELKVCDFGLSRQCCGGGVAVPGPYTNWVGTLWYRAPELLLKAKGYSGAVDMWAAGCIMAELLGKVPIFRGKDEIDQLHQIFEVLGTPDKETWPMFSRLCAELKVGFPRQPSNVLKEKLLLHGGGSDSAAAMLSTAGHDLLMGLLRYDPSRRMTAKQALNHRWFRESPVPMQLRFAKP